ncbi:MAG: metallophosphoesterase family protein [Bosea sp. (in: a-proteobacteria)]
MSAANGADRPFRVVQVSDTHLSETHAYFIDNYDVFVEEMRALKPDLIVHTGDISFNGPVRSDDLSFAKAQLDRLPATVLMLAGNHDIGEAPPFSRLDQPINDARMSAWTSAIGPMWWSHDIGNWRLIGLDTALMASGLDEEAAQHSFLSEQLASRGNRPAMVFMHMPPFETDPNDERATTSCVPHSARGALLDTCRNAGVKVIACGHLHVYRRLRYQGMGIVWAPPTAMVNFERQWRKWRRWSRPGYLIWTLDGGKISHELVEPRMMIAQDTSRWTDIGGTTTNMPQRSLIRHHLPD